MLGELALGRLQHDDQRAFACAHRVRCDGMRADLTHLSVDFHLRFAVLVPRLADDRDSRWFRARRLCECGQGDKRKQTRPHQHKDSFARYVQKALRQIWLRPSDSKRFSERIYAEYGTATNISRR